LVYVDFLGCEGFCGQRLKLRGGMPEDGVRNENVAVDGLLYAPGRHVNKRT